MTYISGAITGTNDYLERFANAETRLTGKIINPAKVCDTLPESPYRLYMEVCLTMLGWCDSIYMLEGWETSDGAKEEYAFAQKHFMDIIFEKAEKLHEFTKGGENV